MREVPAYSPADIEAKWQRHWEENHSFAAEKSHAKPKFYPLIEFPYPSGAGLHVGHPRSNTAMDIIARKRRMEGYNVLFPIGYDAFGLPTENYAIKNHIHPAVVTEKNIARFRQQLKRLGFSFDYDREISTTDPKYYKWTQWIFLKLFEHGLAYKAEMPINWCTSCKVGLANEEVVNGVCERCGGEVVRRVKSQWMLKITDYAQKLLDGLEQVDFIDRVKTQQRNWIGRSEGAEVDFTLSTGDKLRVYTTRPDTLFGATYMVMSPEHPLIDQHREQIANYDAIVAYREAAARKSDFERTELNKDKTGVAIEGITATNPVTGAQIPVWVSDYVLMGYGTGAIMAVPAHDERDWAFATKFGLPIVEVVAGGNVQEAAYTDITDGVMVNSGFLNGMKVAEAKKAIIDWLTEQGLGERHVNYKLRDWVFSRQRYWGEPIPLVKCPHCGWVPLPEDQLPLKLPEVESYEPTDNGESPLAAMTDWVNTTCPKCGGPAQRETDTMPQWAGSSWYFLRYIDPWNDGCLADPEEMKYWLPVDWYNGGMEHTTLHLLYSRFWHRFLYDIGVVPTPEPYQKRTSHGMILGADGEKMSKSRGNVINPDDIVDELGADAFRMYEMFMGAFDQAIPWSTDGARGCRRFLDRVWRLQEMLIDGDGIRDDMAFDVHSCIKKVSEDYERMKYNTAIAAMMTLVNAFYAKGSITKGELRALILLLNPVAPHITEEMNERNGCVDGELLHAKWPEYDEGKLVKSTVEIAVQVNGKMRCRMDVPADLTREGAADYFLPMPEVQSLIDGKSVKKLVYVPGRLLNLVVG
ncbi:MAG TPA: leucine--tRNA ligase [Candidatus Faecivicinus avistercoris]|nr:leucine--tRNA ligase [Candidatus Faecivicinus avistercoris]